MPAFAAPPPRLDPCSSPANTGATDPVARDCLRSDRRATVPESQSAGGDQVKLEGAGGVLAQGRLVDERIVFTRVLYNQLDDRALQSRPKPGSAALSLPVTPSADTSSAAAGAVSATRRWMKRRVSVSSFHCTSCLSALNLGDHKEARLLGLAEIDPFDRARVDHRRVTAFIEILGFVDVPEGHIVEPRVAHQRGRHEPDRSPASRCARTHTARLPQRHEL